jgi:diguanylate cyclase (GGDEF)-like protein
MIKLTPEQFEAIVTQGREGKPLEICGLLAGTQDGNATEVVAVYPVESDDKSPLTYSINAVGYMKASREIEQRGLSIVGIYHTHPATQAYPSLTDVARAHWGDTDDLSFPDYSYLIVSLRDPSNPEPHCYKIKGRRIPEDIVEEPIVVSFSTYMEAIDRDSMTGLYNQREILERLDEEFHRAERQKRPLTIIMMDVNDFKHFNDTQGYSAGDLILKRIAEVLEEEFRKSDILGRYSGDQFIAVLPDTDVPLALVVAQRLRSRMAIEGFIREGADDVVPIALSFGIATFPDDCNDRSELVALADANLSTAKSSKGGIVGTTKAPLGQQRPAGSGIEPGSS